MGSACSSHGDNLVCSTEQPQEFDKSAKYSGERGSRDSAAFDSETKVVEVRKVHSFKLPPPRINLVGFKSPLGNGRKTNEEITAEKICSFLPQHLLYNLKSLYFRNGTVVSDKNNKATEEEADISDLSPLSNFTNDTCILRIDISGFTDLTESLSKEPNGAELLTKHINQYFTTLIAFIYDFGGDIERFVGDTIICQFHYPRRDRTLSECVIAAVQCALRIQQTEYLKLFKVNNHVFIQIRCGVSIGSVTTHHLGGFNNNWLRIAAGQALLDISSALDYSLVGQVVLTRPCFEKCSNYITCRKLDIQDADVYVALGSKREPLSGVSLPSMTIYSDFIPIIRKFLCQPIRDKIDAGQSEWLNEIKPLTIGFLSITDKKKHKSTQDEMQSYQQYLIRVQQVLDTFEGFIVNIFSNEKGTIIILFAFGYLVGDVCDPSRAAKAGSELSSILSNLGMKFGLGFASGKCFIGSVYVIIIVFVLMKNILRGSEYRKDFAIYGDKVKVAARLMKESEKNGGILLCEDTALMLKGTPIEPLEPIKVKGKSEMIKIWRVKDTNELQ